MNPRFEMNFIRWEVLREEKIDLKSGGKRKTGNSREPERTDIPARFLSPTIKQASYYMGGVSVGA